LQIGLQYALVVAGQRALAGVAAAAPDQSFATPPIPDRHSMLAAEQRRWEMRGATRTIELFKQECRQFRQIGGDGSNVQIAMDVGRDKSTTIGCGIAVFEDCVLDWTVTYEEYIYCLEGSLTLRTESERFILEPGSAAWLPKGTKLAYEATQKSTAVYTIYPVNWRNRELNRAKLPGSSDP
jgi:ethanolamine utilization protein EutQ (cupin superfamily)